MPWALYFQSLVGGGVIGLAAALLLHLNGRTAGVSGVAGELIGGALGRIGGASIENAAFIAGLLLGPIVFLFAFGAFPEVHITATVPILVIGGLLVGYGTRLGSGCTSGHGVCGLARLSHRSLAAVAIFFGFAAVTVFVMEHAL